MQGAWRNHGCHLTPLRFLLIGREVLRICLDALALNALDRLNSHDAGQVWVLALIFVVAPTVRYAVQVHTRRELGLVPIEARLITQDLS